VRTQWHDCDPLKGAKRPCQAVPCVLRYLVVVCVMCDAWRSSLNATVLSLGARQGRRGYRAKRMSASDSKKALDNALLLLGNMRHPVLPPVVVVVL